MKDIYTVGIDPGLYNGSIVLLKNGKVKKKWILPHIKKKEINKKEMKKILKRLLKKDPTVYLEQVHAIYGVSAAATASFMKAFGEIVSAVEVLGLRRIEIKPKVWQDVMFAGIPDMRKALTKKEKNEGRKNGKRDTKAMALIASNRLFPKTNFTPKKCRVPNDGLIDGALIGLFGYWSLIKQDAEKKKKKAKKSGKKKRLRK